MYIIIRPRETMAEVYERSLAEESLLAEMEKHRSCPTCRAACPRTGSCVRTAGRGCTGSAPPASG